LAEAINSKGINLVWLGRSEEGLTFLKAALDIYTIMGDKNNSAIVQQDMGATYRAMGNFDQAQLCYQQALAYWVVRDSNRAAALHNNLGVLEHFWGDYPKAFGHFEEALRLSRQTQYKRLDNTFAKNILR
jgi:tetratricopeptide (TPR) repeat protein